MTTANQFGFIGFVGETRREMDLRFQAALRAAVAAGTETCATSPSTEMGTRHPIAGYTRE
jgi:hypothetical protein